MNNRKSLKFLEQKKQLLPGTESLHMPDGKLSILSAFCYPVSENCIFSIVSSGLVIR